MIIERISSNTWKYKTENTAHTVTISENLEWALKKPSFEPKITKNIGIISLKGVDISKIIEHIINGLEEQNLDYTLDDIFEFKLSIQKLTK